MTSNRKNPFILSLFLPVCGALGAGTVLGCSSDDSTSDANGGRTGGSSTGGSSTGGASTGGSGAKPTGTGGASSGTALVGTFSVVLNPPENASSPPFTSVIGKVYSGEYPTDVIETPVASGNGCTTYRFSRQPCVNVTCTGSQICAAPDECRDAPRLVSVGGVSLTGIGSGMLTLAAVNNNYQYPSDIEYPGFDEGAPITLTAKGDHYPAFEVSTTGVAPAVLKEDSYLLDTEQALPVEWEPGSNADAEVSIVLNISKHGGSAGYLRCDTDDSGSFTIPAEPITALIGLGVAGYPQLTFTRRTRGTADVPGGKVALEVRAEAVPSLAVEGYCSCFDSSDCGSCSDSTKTVCDSVRKLCHAP